MTKSTQSSITLMRHGLSTANQAGIVQGQLDYPLHEEGIVQGRSLANYWFTHGRTYETIICSPLERALETAKLIASKLKIPIIEEPLWMERRFGEAEGLPYEQVRKSIDSLTGSVLSVDPISNDGESEWDLFNRASQAIQLIIQSEWKTSLVVSHGGILDAALRSILDIQSRPGENRRSRFNFDNTGFTDIVFDQQTAQWHITCHNAQPHLELCQ